MLREIALSITDFSFYRKVPEKPFANTFWYLSLLSLLFSFAVMIAIFIYVRPNIREATDWAAQSIPTLTLDNGKLKSSVQGPTEIRHPEFDELAFIIEAERTTPVTLAEMQDKNVMAYMTQDTAFVVAANGRLERYPLASSKDGQPLVLDEQFYYQLGGTLGKLIYPIAFITSILTFIVWKHIAALFYSVIALLLSKIQKGELPFESLYRIAVYAQTPVIALQTAALFLPRPVPFFGLIGLLVATVYLWYAIKSTSAPPEAPEAPAAA